MSDLKLPNMFTKEEFQKLPPIKKSEYVEQVVEKILELNQGDGITIKQILNSTEFERAAISKFLEKSVAKRSAYKVVQGNTIVYYKNGRLIHHLFKRDMELGGRVFDFKALFDGKEILVYIQENKKSPLGIIEEGGGILVPLKELSRFVGCLNEVETQTAFIKNKFLEMIE